MIRLIHLSDIHFEALYGKYPENVQKALQKGVFHAFSKAVEFAIDEEVDLFIIAGDILDRPKMSYKAERFFYKKIEEMISNSIDIVLIHGNHDPSSAFKWKWMPSGVTIFSNNSPQTITLRSRDDDIYYVSGAGFENQAEMNIDLNAFPIRKEGTVHIGALHSYLKSSVSIEERDPYMPTSGDALAEKNYNYWALGHIHKSMYYPNWRVAYAGCLQGLNSKETGQKGGYFVEIEAEDSAAKVKFVPFAQYRFETESVKIDESAQRLRDIERSISEHIANLPNNMPKEDLILQVNLSGQTALYEELSVERHRVQIEESLKSEFNLLHLELRFEELRPLIDKDKYVKASPFISFINQVLSDQNMHEDLIEFAKMQNFLEAPADMVEKEDWIKQLSENMGDDWLYKLVKTNDN